MAVKMSLMAVSDIDKQFSDNNLLTDEDFQFDINGCLDDVFDQDGLLKYISSDVEMAKVVENGNGNVDLIDDSILDFLNNAAEQIDIKVEPMSPNSVVESPMSPESFWASESDGSVIMKPEGNSPGHLGVVIPDTPPHTPPNMLEHSTVVVSNGTNGAPVLMPVLSPTVLNNILPMQPVPPLNGISVPKPAQKSTPNSELKIKPKPLNGTVNNAGNSKPLVLTPEQFLALTNGKLKLKSVCEVGSSVSPSLTPPQMKCDKPMAPSSLLPPVNRKLFKSNNSKTTADLMALKRQQRMIKNRESACLSRKKKKEYMSKLEAEIKEIAIENEKLRVENTQLRSRINHLEKENASLKMLNECLKSRISPNTLKKTTGLMVVLFMITFNLAPIGRLFEKSLPVETPKVLPHHVGRTLLWDESAILSDVGNGSSDLNNPMNYSDSSFSLKFLDDYHSALNVTMCPTYINRTESLRLDNDLRGWVQRVEKKQKQKQSMMNTFIVNSNEKRLPPLPKLQPWMKRKNEKQKFSWGKHGSRGEILVYHTPRETYEGFFDAINRRDDTFYFVSFSGDHLLLPATTHNQTQRPRMSLVMPAMTFNDSMGNLNDHVCMMQIDCEVMNTKMVYIKESAIPQHLRQKSNGTKPSDNKKSSRFSVHEREGGLQKRRLPGRTPG